MGKFVDDVFKDNDSAWDMVRIGMGFAAWSATAIILYHMVIDDKLVEHLAVYIGSLVATWTGYATAVWGHSFAKK